ncbi:MAG: hypothetical protein D6820_13940 [Lentisphaerae bacterium]|nr:MAG: hypothetical protein D6820_13940 [Lentisphaerota bacterium]
MKQSVFHSARWRVGTAVLGGAVVLWSCIILSSRIPWRWDVTRNHRNLLSAGSIAILEQVHQPVTISFYFSWSEKTVPQPYKDYAQRIRDLLENYRHFSPQWLRLRFIDAQPESDIEETLAFLGLSPHFLNNRQQYFYMGLHIACAEHEVTIPTLQLNQEQSLEYIISRAILNVIQPQRRRIGVLSSLPVFGAISGNTLFYGRNSLRPWLFIRELQKRYEVIRLTADLETWPKDLDCLILIHPRDLPAGTQYAIDQYLMHGGRILMLIDPLSSVAVRGSGLLRPREFSPYRSQGPWLQGAWGFTFDPKSILADPTSSVERESHDQPAFLKLSGQEVQTDIVTSGLQELMFPYAGVLQRVPAQKLKSIPLIKSTPYSVTISAEKLFTASTDFDSYYNAAKKQSYTLAMRIEGSFPTLFSKVPDEPLPELPWRDHREQSPDTQIMVVGDCDFIEDRIWSRRIFNQYTRKESTEKLNDNNVFLQNMVDYLAGGHELIRIRSRELPKGFSRVNELWRQADLRIREQLQHWRAEAKKIRAELAKQQSSRDASALIQTPEEQIQREKLLRRQHTIRRKILALMRERRREIDRLGTRIVWLNLMIAPLIVVSIGALIALYRKWQEGRRS